MAASAWIAALAIAVAAAGCSPSAPSPGLISGRASAAASALTTVPAPARSTPSSEPASPPVTAPTMTPAPTLPASPATILGTIEIPGNPNGMIAAYGSVWVASRHTNTVYRIARATGQVTARIAVAAEPAYFADDGHAVWVVEQGAGSIARIDPTTDAVQQVALPGNPGGLPIVGGGAVWQSTDAGVFKIDAGSRRVVGTITPPTPPGVAFAAGRLWAAADGGQGVVRIDPVTLRTTDTVAAGIDASGMIAADPQSVWAASATEITRLDVLTGRVLATYPVPVSLDGSMGVLSGGTLWLQQLDPDGFARLSPASAGVSPIDTLPDTVTESLWFLSLGPHELWVSDWSADAVYRIDPDR